MEPPLPSGDLHEANVQRDSWPEVAARWRDGIVWAERRIDDARHLFAFHDQRTDGTMAFDGEIDAAYDRLHAEVDNAAVDVGAIGAEHVEESTDAATKWAYNVRRPSSPERT